MDETWVRSITLNPASIAIGISALVTLLNGASRALVQHRRPLPEDFFLGIGLVLGASGTTLTNLAKALLKGGDPPPEALYEALSFAPLLGLLIINMLFQQEVERRIAASRSPGLPGWIANLLGFAAMVGAIKLGVGGG
jgi:uncharacterized membrane protein YfcA